MKNDHENQSIHPVVSALKNLLGKLFQQPDIYPIKYYKKGNRCRKKDRSALIR